MYETPTTSEYVMSVLMTTEGQPGIPGTINVWVKHPPDMGALIKQCLLLAVAHGSLEVNSFPQGWGWGLDSDGGLGWGSGMSVFVVVNSSSSAIDLGEGIILGVGSINERWRYYVAPSLIGRAHIQIDPSSGDKFPNRIQCYNPRHPRLVDLIISSLGHKTT